MSPQPVARGSRGATQLVRVSVSVRFSQARALTARWTKTLLSKVNSHHAIDLRVSIVAQGSRGATQLVRVRHAYGALLDEIVAKARNVSEQFTFLFK